MENATLSTAAKSAVSHLDADRLIGHLEVFDLEEEVAGAESVESSTNDKTISSFLVFIHGQA